MTTRRWMILIVIVAVVFTAERMRARRAAYVRLRNEHATAEFILNRQIEDARNSGSLYIDPVELKAMIDRFITFAAYHSSLRRKYEYAASHPWRSVPPDPPRPPGSPVYPLPIF